MTAEQEVWEAKCVKCEYHYGDVNRRSFTKGQNQEKKCYKQNADKSINQNAIDWLIIPPYYKQ